MMWQTAKTSLLSYLPGCTALHCTALKMGNIVFPLLSPSKLPKKSSFQIQKTFLLCKKSMHLREKNANASDILYCTLLAFPVLHCTAIYYSSLQCYLPYCTELQFIIQHFYLQKQN